MHEEKTKDETKQCSSRCTHVNKNGIINMYSDCLQGMGLERDISGLKITPTIPLIHIKK